MSEKGVCLIIYFNPRADVYKGDEVGEDINVTAGGNTSNFEGLQIGEDIVGNTVSGECINKVGAGDVVDVEVINEVATSHGVDINAEFPNIEDLGHATYEYEVWVGEKEISQDSADLLVNVEVASDLNDEGEYGETDDDSSDQICGAYMDRGQKST
ncbi:hypothetical protein V6N13_027423 [Hibiscus sabdariffa]